MPVLAVLAVGAAPEPAINSQTFNELATLHPQEVEGRNRCLQALLWGTARICALEGASDLQLGQ